MPDIVTGYSLSTPGGTINFNAGIMGDGTNKYWLQTIQGLDGVEIRAPVDNVPFGDGAIVHTFWKGPRRPLFEGVFLIESSTNQADCQPIRNIMSEALRVALDSIIAADGTLSWTPDGFGARSLTVRNEVPLDVRYEQDYRLSSFSFGLISEASDW
jgi:hypothetical protein